MWPFKKKLEDVLYEKKKIRIKGIKFFIQKIDPLHYLDGSKVMLQEFDTYKIKDNKNSEDAYSKALEKTKAHFRDIFMAAVISPKLKRKEDGDGVLVDDLFKDWSLANKLYDEIIEFTYGKKNFKRSI